MTKPDETVQLLKEIRDLQREQLAFQRAQSELAEHYRNMTRMMRAVRIGVTILIGMLVISAYWYLYQTIGSIF